MASHNELGKEGEELALGWLRKNGFEILNCNWRFSRDEIDIIAAKDGRVHFVEVKSRHYFPGAYPEESVTKKKFRFLLRAADEYMYQHPEYKQGQVDVLAITIYKNKEPEFRMFDDVNL